MNLVGTQIAGYRLSDELGAGGMGTVYKAQSDGGDVVAIKIVHPQLLDKPGAVERFVREAEIGQRLRHPNIVRTLAAESWESDGVTLHALVMEYVEGQTLAQMRAELGHLPDELCRHVGREVARALDAIHEAGVVHRDIKPSNVLVTPDHAIKVMDLGVAMLVDEALRMTQTGDFVGSLLYAAPEQFRSDATIDGRTDLFALGVSLYELATGRHPFGGKPAWQGNLDGAGADSATSINPNLSPFLDELVGSLIAADPENRPASARMLADLLEAGEQARWWIERAERRLKLDVPRHRRLPVPRDTKLYGREPELASLQSLLDDATGRRGQAVLLRGEAGVGKTRLVDEFVASLNTPCHFLFGHYPPGGAATGSGAFATAFLHHFGEHNLQQTLEPHLPELEAIVPAFAAMLRGTPLPSDVAALGVDGVRAAFLQLARSISKEKPVVLFIDDLQFAPESGRGLFASLADAIADDPILLIGAIRPGAHEEWVSTLTRHGRVRATKVERLGVHDLGQLLIEAFASEELASEYAYSIALKSDCNPFFAFEIVRDLRERGEVIRTADGSWTSSGFLKNIQVPASVRELIEHRLRHLSAEEQDLLEIAACCGHRFDPSLVTDVAGEPLVPTLKRFRDIERKHRLIRADGREYVFDHQQIQEALYELSFVQLREQYHAAIGAALEARCPDARGDDALRLCHHHFRGRQAALAVPHLKAAWKHLEEQHLHQDRIELATQALDSGALSPTERVAALRNRAGAARALGDAETDIASAREATDLAGTIGDPDLRAQTAISLAGALITTGAYHEAAVHYEEALAVGRSTNAIKSVASAHRGLGLVSLMTGATVEAESHYARTLELAIEQGDFEEQVAAHANLGTTLPTLGRTREAEEHLESAIRIGSRIGSLRDVGTAHSNLGRIHFHRGDFEGALLHAGKFRDAMRKIGDRRGEVTASIVMCAIWRQMGALEEMMRDLDYALKWGERTGDRWMESYAHMGLAWIAEQRGDRPTAAAAYRKALALREAVHAAEEIADCHAALGRMAMEDGDTDSARDHFRTAIATAKEPQGSAATLASCGLACIGDTLLDDAAAQIDAAVDSIPLTTRVEAYHTLAQVPGGEKYREQAKRWLDTLVEQLPPERRAASRERITIHRTLSDDG